MEIDEIAARVMRRYWPLLLVAVLVPVLVTGVVVNLQQPQYTAVTRLDSPNPNADVAGDAGVAITVSQVKAFATSYGLLAEAIKERRVDRSPTQVAPRIDVTGLGTSSVVELMVVDSDPLVAGHLANTVANKVVTQLNESNNSNLNTQISTLDKQIASLSKKLKGVSSRAQDPRNFSAINEKASLQSRIDGLQADRRDLRNQLASVGVSRVVQPAVVTRQASGKVARLVLVALLGLVGGVLITIFIEAFRPTVPGSHRVARRLGVPLLGQADQSEAELADLGRRIRLAARRDYVAKVALVGAGDVALPADLVSRVAVAVRGGTTQIVTARAFDGPAGSPARAGTDPGDGLSRTAGTAAGTNLNSADGAGGDERGGNLGPLGRKPRERQQPRGTAIVHTATAFINQHTPHPVPAPEQEECQVHAFEDIDPGADTGRFGLVAVVGPVTTLAAVRSIHDLAVASGWPLLGVVATARPIKG